MEQESKLKYLFYILIILVIIAIIFAAVSYKKPLLRNRYVYTSPSGEEFLFVKTKLGNLTYHTATVYAFDRQGNKHQVDIPFINDPYSIEEIPILNEVKSKILNKQGIFVTLDPYGDSKSVLASIEITRVIGTNDYGVFKIPTQSATFKPTNTTFPYINCANATKQVGVIYLFVGNKTRIASLGECVVVEGKSYDDLVKAADKLTLHLLGIM